MLIVLSSAVLVRVPFLAEPFECDQANYAYVAQHWGEGLTPYRYSWDNKPPLIYIWYRFIAAFLGDSQRGTHLGFIFLAVGATLFFYALSRRLFSRGFALLSALVYGVFSAGALISGTFAIPENLAAFFIIAGFYYFWNGCEREKNIPFLISGIFLGFALMSKQAAFWELAALSGFFVLTGLRSTTFLLVGWRLILFWSGAAAVIIFFIILFVILQAAAEFFSSVFIYNLFFGRIVGFRQGLINFFQALLWSPRENFLLWIFAFAGLIIAVLKREKKTLLFILWFIAAVLGIVCVFQFYPHFFIQAIPILALLTIYFLQTVWNTPGISRKVISLVLLTVMGLYFCMVQWRWWFSYSPLDSLINRRGALARPQLYRQTQDVATYIKANSAPEDLVYVWGLWPEVYYYSKRKSPSKYFYISSRATLTGKFKEVVQTQVYYDIIRNPPKYIIIDEQFADLISVALQRYINGGYALVKTGADYRILRIKDTVEGDGKGVDR